MPALLNGVAAYFTDVTDRRNALVTAERARARSELLAALAGDLAELLDPVQALEAVLPHLVPAVADFAVASVLDEGHGSWAQRTHDVAALHADPALHPVLQEYSALRVPSLTGTSLVARAVSTGRSVTSSCTSTCG